MTRTVAVVGGGPAGLMAAEVIASEGHDVRVVVFDRMPSVGRKLQLAGRGGLNLTHTEPLDLFLTRYGAARELLEPAIRAFDPAALRAWSSALGQRAVVGTSGRVFPESFRATPLLRAWIERLRDLGVELRTGHTWQGWTGVDEGDLAFAPPYGPFRADATILAMGGASWPRTGSDGAWVEPVMGEGIVVAPLRAANAGFDIAWSSYFRERFGGQPLKNVALTSGDGTVRGEAMVTTAGLEGGAVYAAGPAVRRRLDSGKQTVIDVDLRPDLPERELYRRLAGRRPKDSMTSTLRRAGLTPVAGALVREAGELPTDPKALAERIKKVRLRVTGIRPIDRAISSAGGIAFDEIDDAFMVRRRPGTFVAGEMLDWEAPTGGYLLQATFSTAVAAAHGTLAWLTKRDSV